ncbi:GNAT family N-acetyltransferase [Corallococcus praedator]|uniref:GNAT family N-acetyltransferase n=1 Tax=Corallococcus praedator TaxID=2316724 RepID=A0ABX9QF97_9BACT|nr:MULTISPECIES: GNAT family N-acetyltransferase [Corallococcus]RKH18702.1 GNAT family N-acetyltransferase [Corallococcus sp. CA047B]RKH33769.1 GNAT family N-acetyltransferase [Corallococcus sp. CA031C]RKI06340.1 GNAT family N-acetyltransferase [Corallococcus praedator]
MPSLNCRVADTQRELDDALRVRWEVFGVELRMLGDKKPQAPREANCFDTLPTTAHVVVYSGEEAVATARLLLPNAEVAASAGSLLGLDIERKLDLSEIAAPGRVFAETTRYCVRRDWRNSAVLRLQACLYRESRRRGVTHWIAAANMETDSVEEASLIYRAAARRGWVSDRFHVRTREFPPPPREPVAMRLGPTELERARHGALDGLKMPPVLSLFADKMGARFIGPPHYDTAFHRFTVPLVAALDEIPRRTLSLFDSLDADAA